jgi:hypothetical protein
MARKLLFFLLLAVAGKVAAQLYPGGNINVIINNESLPNPWAGGLDLPQFSAVDFNQDGVQDIAIFDKKANKFLIFLGDGNGNFKYAPQYEPIFPKTINNAFFRDFNCDGLDDIITNVIDGAPGFRVFKQLLDEDGIPYFILENELLKYEFNGFDINIYKFNDDIPVVDDVDGDGDLDIIVMGLLGTSAEYYKNISVELGYGCDSLIFELEHLCWGNFREGSSDNTVFLDYCCMGDCMVAPDTLPENSRHAGTTFTVLDPDERGMMNLLIGDVDGTNLTYLKNGGSAEYAHFVYKDSTFPNYDVPVNMPLFPAAYNLDVNNDGKKDLLIAPNSYTSHLNVGNVFYYENTGDSTERFRLVQNDFLVNQMIDFGSFSHATFFDHDGDGLLDLIVSNGYKFISSSNTEGSLYYFRNTGTAENPEFTFVTDNYQNVKNLGLEFIRPTFGDIDGDGDLDMILGDINGFLHLFTNTAGAGNEASFTLTQLQYASIDVGSFCHPQLVDLNGDGLLDLVVGRSESRGEILYFENTGTAQVPQFSSTPTNEALGKIRVNEPGWLLGFSSPFVTDEDTSGNRYIYSGSDVGIIYKYLINPDSLYSGSFDLISDSVLPVNIGIRSTITIADINNDGYSDYFMGNARGGIHFYSETITDSSLVFIEPTEINSISELVPVAFSLYPNPAKNSFTVETEQFTGVAELQVFNLLGKLVAQQNFRGGKTNVDAAGFANGIYFVKVSFNNQSLIKKLMIE